MRDVLALDPSTLAAILAMAAATYACRGGGYWLFRRINPTPPVRAVLGYVPGTLFVAYVVPALAAGGAQQWAGAAATAAIMLATRNLALAILGGTAAAWAVWAGVRPPSGEDLVSISCAVPGGLARPLAVAGAGMPLAPAGRGVEHARGAPA